jgi:hypothetical protein
VQSERAIVEQTIADLKNFKVMENNKITKMDDREKELDCVIALHNFNKLRQMNENFDVPERRHVIAGEHVFKPSVPLNELDLKIPNPIKQNMEGNIKHIRKFEDFLSNAVPAIKTALEIGGEGSVFFPTVSKRGENLHNGAYVLQLKVGDEDLGVWTVKFTVGASYSYDTHTGYFQLSRDDAVIHNICCCYSGYGIKSVWNAFSVLYAPHNFFITFFLELVLVLI